MDSCCAWQLNTNAMIVDLEVIDMGVSNPTVDPYAVQKHNGGCPGFTILDACGQEALKLIQAWALKCMVDLN
jgi:hypothetical protein